MTIRRVVLLTAAIAVPALAPSFVQGQDANFDRVTGSVMFQFENAGVSFAVKGDQDGMPTDEHASLEIAPNSGVAAQDADGVRAAGRIQMYGAIVVNFPGGEVYLTDPALEVIDGQWTVVYGANSEPAFEIRHRLLKGDSALVGGWLVMSEELAAATGQESGHIAGSLITDAEITDEVASRSQVLDTSDLLYRHEGPEFSNGVSSAIDVGCSRVGLNSSGSGNDTHYYGVSSSIRSYSFATTSCNYGSQVAEWIDFPSMSHPVIAQNIYRLQEGRFEQVGQSWLKHSFCAVSEPTCGSCSGTPCQTLGVGCADTYWATLNDGASGGPKSRINPQGEGTVHSPNNHSWSAASGPTAIRGRLQVKDAEITTGTPNVNGGTMYFVEAQYVTHDEHRSNRNNNASWRQIYFSSMTSDPATTGVGQSSVHAQEQAIEAWKDEDPEVTLAHTYEVFGGSPWGRYTVGYRAYDNGNNTWDYEYAVHNLNGDRGVGTFSVPIPSGVSVSSVGFHDVDYHSGEPYSGADWTHVVENDAITWSTQTFAENVNANAIRWGTLYNFRFTANTEPTFANVTLGMFKPGSPEFITAFVGGPSAATTCGTTADCADTDGNGIRDDACVWWECDAGACNGIDIDFADLGGDNGACPPNGAVDGNDRFHALNCFANQSTSGVPGEEYPCETDPPGAMRVDAAGFRAPCTPDGVCDANDAFAAINVFEDNSPCTCGPAPVFDPVVIDRVNVSLEADADIVRPGDLVRVTVRLDGPVSDLRGYQLHAEARGGLRGHLELVDMSIEDRRDWAFAGSGDFRAFNVDTAQLLSGLDTAGVQTEADAYLATLTYRVSKDATGPFMVDVRLNDTAGRSGLFATSSNSAIEISGTTAAEIQVGRTRTRVSSR